MLDGICDVGVCESDMMGIKFALDMNGVRSYGFTECDYPDKGTDLAGLKNYLAKAKCRRSPLSLLICNEHLKKNLRLAYLAKKENTDTSFTQFNVNIYTILRNHNSLQTIPLVEFRKTSGVLIIVEMDLQFIDEVGDTKIGTLGWIFIIK